MDDGKKAVNGLKGQAKRQGASRACFHHPQMQN